VAGVRQGLPETSLILEALTRGYLFSYRLGPALDSVQRLLRRKLYLGATKVTDKGKPT
jgi:hypothetical protein